MYNFEGRRLKVAFPNSTETPFVRPITSQVYNGEFAGAELEMLNYIANVMNFTFE